MIKMNIFTIDKHDGDRKWALNINIGERQFSFVIPNYWDTSYGLGFQSNHPNKFIDNQHWKKTIIQISLMIHLQQE